MSRFIKTNRIKKSRKLWRERLHRLGRRLASRWIRWPAAVLLALFLISTATAVLNPVLFPPIKNYNFGVSFSKERSEQLGLDWRANYLALLDDLKIRRFRLMSYWSSHEPVRGQMDFSDLDWMMDQAAARGAQVSLAIGLRQPRWPECFQPAWAANLSGNAWKQALYAYIEAVVKRYEKHPALQSWQLENEAVNNWFGVCPPPDRQRLVEEFNLVRGISKKPIWMSLSDQHGLPLGQPVPDAYGFSIYRVVYNDKLIPGYTWYPTPLWYHRLRAVLIKLLHPKAKLFVHELQLEPWGPVDVSRLSAAEQNRTMSYDQIHFNTTFARQVGFQDIYAWGGEWWYWRKVKSGDNAVWEAVRREIEASRN
ncbi:MAG: hypothetical protein EOT04_03040 [Candidatus Chaera renei]|uniref:Glycoside hydrolase family 42 N-terminal domain-containing protein n=1 Tax=Candidatus Chaera renei TaxID=2506947 RepID=A0A4Q0AHN2_9BACT|nr:MAG: hypothetical protein EOT04_03040 [Candidatus Chaera renei]